MNRFATLARAAAPVAAVALAGAVLLRFPPGQYSFYPQCPVYASLHIECPGCGTTRALAALLHGNVAEALRLNALTTVMLPLAAAYAVIFYRRWLRREAFRWPRLPPASIYATVAVAVVFMVLRNLPDGLL
jgi:amino acid transporter